MKNKYEVLVESLSDGACTWVVMGQDKAWPGGHYGVSAYAHDALKTMLQQAGGIHHIAKYKDHDDPTRIGKKAIRFVCIPFPPEKLAVHISNVGEISWTLINK